MKLPFFKNFTKKKPIFFLVLVLRNEKASAVIFEEQKGKIRVIEQHEESFQDSIDNASQEELLEVLDSVVSKTESALPQNSNLQKTIFGVKEDWVEDNKIKKEHLLKLKKICDKLGLTPIGFLIISQAVSFLLQKEEGAPISAILVDTGNKYTTITLIRSGKIIETKSAEIQDSIPATVDALLKQFSSSQILPSRIIVVEGRKDLSQEFIHHHWTKSLPFLHLPQITNLNVGFEARAILIGVANQMGFEVLEEIVQKKTEENQEEKQPQNTFENLSMENFGFIKNVDVQKEQDENINTVSLVKKDSMQSEQKKFHIIPSFGRKKIILISMSIIILLIGLILFYLFGIKATVILDIKPKTIKQSSELIFSGIASAIEGENILKGEPLSVALDGTVSSSTTGKKDVGNKAKGEITVFNNTISSKIFQKGTIITSSNGLDFTLANNVTIASASGDVFSGTTPGKAKVNVSATKIGVESNLPSNTKFSIGDNPLIAAKNDDPFEGGTKKTVAVVSKNDVDNLLQQLPKKLEEKAINELTKLTPPNNNLLPILLITTVDKKEFNKSIDEETDKVTLKGTVTYNALSYRKKDLMTQALRLIKTNIKKDQELEENNIKVDIMDLQKKNENEAKANLDIEAILQPKIDKNKLIAEITGLSYKDAEKILLKIPQSSSVKISSSLDIPLFPKTLPKISQNIKMVININD